MRFILFSIATAASIAYLINGDDSQLAHLQIQLQQAKSEILAMASSKFKGEARSSEQKFKEFHKPAEIDMDANRNKNKKANIAEEKSSYQMEPRRSPNVPADNSANNVTKRTSSARVSIQAKTQNLRKSLSPDAGLAEHKATSGPVISAQNRLLPKNDKVAQRRAEVLAASPSITRVPGAPILLEPGTSLMKASERKLELDTLVEEMEMLFVTKVGS